MRVRTMTRIVLPAVLAMGIGIGSAGAAGTAFAATHSSARSHKAAVATVKAGAPCTKAELGKTKKVGKEELSCRKVGKAFKWEVKTEAKKGTKRSSKK
jgi:hypothetical protein